LLQEVQAKIADLRSSLDDLKFTTRDKKTANINKTIMTSISTIMGYLRQGSKPATKKRIKLKEKDRRGSHEEGDSEKAPQKPPVRAFTAYLLKSATAHALRASLCVKFLSSRPAHCALLCKDRML
jgi:hypothetical protein